MCPSEEFDQMISAMKKDLPASFRVTGFRSQAFAVRDLIEGMKKQKIKFAISRFFSFKSVYLLFQKFIF